MAGGPRGVGTDREGGKGLMRNAWQVWVGRRGGDFEYGFDTLMENL
jgi:hypothetical protein